MTKNHSFLDGNKRIAATMFLYFLDRNGVLFAEGEKLIDDSGCADNYDCRIKAGRKGNDDYRDYELLVVDI